LTYSKLLNRIWIQGFIGCRLFNIWSFWGVCLIFFVFTDVFNFTLYFLIFKIWSLFIYLLSILFKIIVIFFIKLHPPWVFYITIYHHFLCCFCNFFINIFLRISFFKIKLVDNYSYWLSLGKKFHRMWILEIRLDLRGLSNLSCFFF
jgi:hypothetical protein